MIIPDTSKTTSTLHSLGDVEQFKKLRNDTTDKVLALLMFAEWDESSMQLKEMVGQMPS
jgi:hypothetical protein